MELADRVDQRHRVVVETLDDLVRHLDVAGQCCGRRGGGRAGLCGGDRPGVVDDGDEEVESVQAATVSIMASRNPA